MVAVVQVGVMWLRRTETLSTSIQAKAESVSLAVAVVLLALAVMVNGSAEVLEQDLAQEELDYSVLDLEAVLVVVAMQEQEAVALVV
jgi:hypothetical protein